MKKEDFNSEAAPMARRAGGSPLRGGEQVLQSKTVEAIIGAAEQRIKHKQLPFRCHRRRWITPVSGLTSKKAQVQQIFIYAIGIVVVGLILVFGYQAVRNLSSQGEQVKAIEFRTQLANDIKGISFGDVRIREYPIPQGFDFVCVSDKENFGPGACFPDDDFEAKYPIVVDAIKTENKDNIFLGGEVAPDSFTLEKMRLGIGICYRDQQPVDIDNDRNTDNDEGDKIPIAVRCFDINNGKLKLNLTGTSIDYGQPRGREFGVVVS